jgi:hypothetical protein
MRALRLLLSILAKSIIGIVAIYFTNLALSNWHIAVGINACNGIIIGILGLSGYLLLYVLVCIDIAIFK